MTEFIPPPTPRPTVTYANCTVVNLPGYRPLHLDLHLPAGDGPFPVVLWIHGGGFQSGSRVWMPESVAPFDFHQRLLARGYAVADVDYRLAFESQYPSQLSDVQAAIRWLRHYATDLKLDPARFAALGESAGGYLAAMAGLLGSPDEQTDVQAVVNWYGVTDLLDFPDKDDPFGGLSALLGGPVNSRLDFTKQSSPLHRVHAGAPPFLNMHGADDVQIPYSQSVDLTEALHAHGVRADLHLVEGADHCFVGCDDIGGLIERCADFLDDVLAK